MSTLIELKDWIEQGGKIRRSDWDKGVYLKKKDCDSFENEEGATTSLCFRLAMSDDWVKVEEDHRWKPKMGKRYFYVNTYFKVCSDPFNDDFSDKQMLKTFNCFKTREEAEQVRDLWLAERELRSLADGGDYVIKYEDDRGFYVDRYFLVATPYRFPSEYAAKEAIEQLGEDKLKLIYGVK